MGLARDLIEAYFVNHDPGGEWSKIKKSEYDKIQKDHTQDTARRMGQYHMVSEPTKLSPKRTHGYKNVAHYGKDLTITHSHPDWNIPSIMKKTISGKEHYFKASPGRRSE